MNTPGIYPLMGPHHLYDAISAAGGLTLKSGRTVTVLHAGQRDHPEVVDLASECRKNPLSHANVTIYPGDTIIVSKAGMVYVLGEVNKPGAFLMEDNTSISVLKATAMAGGTTKLASLKGSMILRKSLQGTIANQDSAGQDLSWQGLRPAVACRRYRVRSPEQHQELRSHGAARRDSGSRLFRLRCSSCTNHHARCGRGNSVMSVNSRRIRAP